MSIYIDPRTCALQNEPEPENQTRGQQRLPVLVRGDDVVHKREEPRRLVHDLDVDIKLDVAVLLL